MLGFVRESRLIKEQKRVSSLEKELQHSRSELQAIQNEIATTEHLRGLKLKDLDEKLATTRSKIDSAKLEFEETIVETSKERDKILTSASREATLVLTAAKESVSTMIDEAQGSAKELIDKTNQECDNTKLIADRENEKLITTAKSKAVQLSLKALLLITKAKENASIIINKAEDSANELINKTAQECEKFIASAKSKAEQQSQEAQAKLNRLEIEIRALEESKLKASKEVSRLEKRQQELKTESENREIAETITPYKYLVNGPVSDQIKSKLEKVKEKQKSLILKGKGFKLKEFILWNDNLASGKARQNRHGKFLITAFNAEVDNIISNTTARNFASSAKKIEKWFDRVNKSGKDSYIELSRDLLALRLEEQRHFFEFKYKKEMELDEQRYMRETLREEAKVKKEIEKFITDREKEEVTYQKSLDAALSKIKTANQEEIEKLNTHIEELKVKLERATNEKDRALSMAQLTRSGYVYVISNKGSFGENIYKIGMTRRLEPLDRVRELSGASVPFHFDVHALIPSDDAPSLENRLHTKFASKRVNKVNQRREFFKLTIKEIEEALTEFVDTDFNIVSDITSDQYEESMLLEEELTE
ncbi:DUF4041 domain-containing protein [Pseudoalteromonas sp. SA25]|uniref:DUF4041 domain-containing protein n=1 Tax=Pseudoalteromonas sp. SA25 TaxID=2686347 RepID=UPI0013FE421E|nr:DUF4041 domain-containing protein [Pseudoalteromonas sp. SA25]